PIYRMDDWRVFSSDDLVNWEPEFTLRPEDTFLGENHECYATDAAERNGKYYLYFSDQQRSTGVAVSENGPGGPYIDALGKPLLPQGLVDTACYDPTVFIDDDENKTPYIMFGYTVVGKKYYIARLNEDMISLAGEPKAVELIDGWENDACWITKWGDTYYLNSHGGEYATSKSVYGPYTYRGRICEDCFTDHGTFFTFHNQTYFTYGVPENYGSGEPLDPYYRTTKFVYAHRKDNGDIVTDDFIKKVGVGQYDATWETIKGEWFFDASDGIVKKENADGFELRGIKDGSHLTFPKICNMPANALLKFRVANGNDAPCTVEIHQENPKGKLLGRCVVGNTGGFNQFKSFKVALKNTAGKHGLCFVFHTKAGEALRFEDFRFAKAK
ncbi:MAG: family 43 glycosylhydrolase, partial [Ruminococcus sp.]|nr:family 43 glycosylhydrolase [Ruminococcus sp.]